MDLTEFVKTVQKSEQLNRIAYLSLKKQNNVDTIPHKKYQKDIDRDRNIVEEHWRKKLTQKRLTNLEKTRKFIKNFEVGKKFTTKSDAFQKIIVSKDKILNFRRK